LEYKFEFKFDGVVLGEEELTGKLSSKSRFPMHGAGVSRISALSQYNV
jgi:hypothetical protein